MMTIRALLPDDIASLKSIHEKYFSNEFEFPDFLKNFYCAFLVEDESGIITAGGVRPICESILVTDLSRTTKDRKLALANMLQASMFTCAKFDFNELHAFVQDDTWKTHLEHVGFHSTKGKSLVLDF